MTVLDWIIPHVPLALDSQNMHMGKSTNVLA